MSQSWPYLSQIAYVPTLIFYKSPPASQLQITLGMSFFVCPLLPIARTKITDRLILPKLSEQIFLILQMSALQCRDVRALVQNCMASKIAGVQTHICLTVSSPQINSILIMIRHIRKLFLQNTDSWKGLKTYNRK